MIQLHAEHAGWPFARASSMQEVGQADLHDRLRPKNLARAPAPSPRHAVWLPLHQVLLRGQQEQLHRCDDGLVPLPVFGKFQDRMRLPVFDSKTGLLLQHTSPLVLARSATGAAGMGHLRRLGQRLACLINHGWRQPRVQQVLASPARSYRHRVPSCLDRAAPLPGSHRSQPRPTALRLGSLTRC
jgi:hypothetical protein